MVKRFLTGGSSTYVVPGFPIPPRDYYITNSGVGDGLSSGAPIGLAAFLTATLHDGDRSYFNKGETYYISEFSKTYLNNIEITGYGSGADPVFKSSTSLSAATWTNEGDGSYSTPLGAAPKWVWINGLSAKNAESAWIPITLNVSAQVRRVLAATINALPDSIVGAGIIFKEYPFRLSQETTVSAYDSGTGNITFVGTVVGAEANFPLKLFNQRQFLSSEGDWCYVSGKLYVKTTATPAGTDISITTGDYAFSFTNCSFINFSGVEFQHSYKYAVNSYSSPYLTITDSTFIHHRGNAIRINGSNNVGVSVTENAISKCELRGIEYGGVVSSDISHNLIHDICQGSNLGRPYDTNRTSGAIIPMVENPHGPTRVTDNTTFTYNEIYDCSYIGIFTWGNSNIIEKNDIHDCLTRFNDGGGIYMFYGNYLGLNSSTTNNIIRNNKVTDIIGNSDGIVSPAADATAGIYLDNGCDTNSVINNTLEDTGVFGIFGNVYTANYTITGNKIAGATRAQIELREDSAGLVQYFALAKMVNVIQTGNILVCKTTAARNVILTNFNNNNTFNPYYTLNNNHYVQPYTTQVNARAPTAGALTQLTFSAWKTYTGLDAAATEYSNYKVTPAADDVVVVFNDSDSSIQVTIPGGHTAVTGAAPSNPYTVTAWDGFIYLKS